MPIEKSKQMSSSVLGLFDRQTKKTPKIFNIHEIKQSKAANSHILKTGAGECLAVFAQ